MAIVTSKVLDEGVDIPDAELGVILSGTGSAREFIQRLGRLLRPKPDKNRSQQHTTSNGYGNSKKARLIEIISSETKETITSARRKRALKIMRNGSNYDHSTDKVIGGVYRIEYANTTIIKSQNKKRGDISAILYET